MNATGAQAVDPRAVELDVVLFDTRCDTEPKPRRIALGALLAVHEVRSSKDGPAWSPVVYRPHSKRAKANVERTTALVFDLDHVSRANRDGLLSRLNGYAWISHTTFSHCVGGEDDGCLRVIVPIAKPIPAASHEAVWRQINAMYLDALADPATKDPSRLHYLPSAPPERAADASIKFQAGVVLDVRDLLAPPLPCSRQPRVSTAYARAALSNEAARVGASREGERNATLNRAAFSLGQLVGSGHLDSVSVEESLVAVALPTGLSEREIRATVRSGLAAGAARPRRTPESSPPQRWPSDDGGTVVSPRRGAQPSSHAPRPPTDYGNAERLVDAHGTDLRFTESHGWLAWSGERWVRSTTEPMRRAKLTARSIYQEAARADDDKVRHDLAAHARSTESARRLEAMLRLAQTEAPVAAKAEEFDRDPMLLNVRNGTIDLRTGALLPHRREDLLTKLAPVVYDPKARLDAWDRFLDETTGGDQGLIAFLRRAAGYSLTGSTAEEKLLFFHGPAASGKSTLVEAIRSMMGDYARTADFESFLARRDVSGAPRNDLASLAGARFVVSIEVDDGKRLASGLLKQLTGGDVVSARLLYREPFEFLPEFKLVLVANDAPRVSEADSGMWRRILRVPFMHEVPEERRDPRLKALLKDPACGGAAILAWAVRGCVEWQAQGLAPSGAVTTATAEYRTSQDPLREFLDERCSLQADQRTSAGDLRTSYEAWCHEVGEQHPLGRRGFAERLGRAGCVQERGTGGTRLWRGIALNGSATRGGE